ncbi:MAG: Rrf2 family transcriptional regulator [Oligoflexia bacterium]|nr:Rrf2 family transcriptional regulator [Oligoflexia bacterium]
MAANSRFAVALHAVAMLACCPQGWVTSARIAKSVNTNPVVVRRVLGALCEAGLVECSLGKSGGARLKRRPSKITLLDVYTALGEQTLLALTPNPANKACAVSCLMKGALHSVFEQAEGALQTTLKSITVADLVKPVCQCN